jgi:antitoxin YefM
MCNYVVMSTLPLGQARNNFSEVIDEVERTHDRVTITRHGRAVAVIMAPADLESLEETLSLLATPGALDAVRESITDLDNGRADSWDRLREEFTPTAASAD